MPHLYSFDQHPDHQTQLDAWAQQWIANALSTAPPHWPTVQSAVEGLYTAADLTPPPRHRIVSVRSPMTAAIAAGAAAGVWWLRENPTQHVRLFGRRLSETDLMCSLVAACAVAVRYGLARLAGVELPLLTRAATWAATWDATEAATWDATWAATWAATEAATEAATWDATRAATGFFVQCMTRWWYMHNGGSDWSGYPAYLSFFRHVAQLDLPIYAKWQHYETLARESASRIMHTRFCIVADRQTSIHIDTQNRLHHETGPARTWGDGWAVWAWHGVRVPRDLVEGRWDAARVLREPNVEVRRCAVERMGWDRFVVEARLSQVGDAVPDPANPGHELTLHDVPEQIFNSPVRVLLCTNATPERDGTRRRFGLTVPVEIDNPLTAAAWTFDLRPEQYHQLEHAY